MRVQLRKSSRSTKNFVLKSFISFLFFAVNQNEPFLFMLPSIAFATGQQPPLFDSGEERILQFGTGILLKGLPDYFIHLYNQRSGKPRLGIVSVKSTAAGEAEHRYAPYTIWEKGVAHGKPVDRCTIAASLSRELNAQTAWPEVLDFARQPQLRIVLSNTTEAGLSFVEEDFRQSPPGSFPAKLLAVLNERFMNRLPGLIVIPCELVPDNGLILKELVLKLARYNRVSEEFLKWLEQENTFCNSLVDRIVSGRPQPEMRRKKEEELGFSDPEMIEAELYALWAIECPKIIEEELGWQGIHPNWILSSDISLYRERKLRILNGSHTFLVGLMWLLGKKTVAECMQDAETAQFIRQLILEEIAPATAVPEEAARSFAQEVLDRFANPYIEHKLINITLQYTMKMATRNLPLIARYEAIFGKVPALMATGFAAYLLFSRPVERDEKGNWLGSWYGKSYPIQDDKAPILAEYWAHEDPEKAMLAIMAEQRLWGDFKFSEGFCNKVLEEAQAIQAQLF